MKRNTGSVILLVLVLGAFMTAIATLFVQDALDTLKYRRQMQSSAAMKIEAYSCLDLGFSFLNKYKNRNELKLMNMFSSSKVPDSITEEEISNKLTEEIANAVATTSTTSIGSMITQNILKDTLAGNIAGTGNPAKKCLVHNNFTIEYTFENLSNKIPLCQEFETLAPGVIGAALNSIGNISQPDVTNFINAGKTFGSWKAFGTTARIDKTHIRDAETLSSKKTITKQTFTLEKFIIEKVKARKFKINNMAASTHVTNALRATPPSPDLTSPNVCCFSLGVRVTDGAKNSFSLICFCDCAVATAGTSVKGRLPFRIVRIEEI